MKHNYLKHLFTALLLMCVAVATAHDFATDGIYYSITDATNKTVEVTYKGDSYNDYSDEYTGSVVIPESVTYNGNTYSVTSIGAYAFRGCSGLTSVVIGNSVTSIGSEAFYGCSGLTSVVIGNSVTSIRAYAFSGCTGLTSIVIPNSVTSIGNSAFWGCSGLEYVTIPDGVKTIGLSAFKGCSSVEELYISSTIESIGDYAFAECNNILDIKIGSKKAITASENVFSSDAYINACLYVPTGRKFAYEKATPWNNFYIVEMDYTGIENVESEDGEVPFVYDLNGRVVENPVNGIYILNGKKVFIK